MSMPVIKLRQSVQFPANVYGDNGVDVSKASGNYTVALDYSDFASLSSLPTSPSNFVLSYDTLAGTYVLIPTSLLGGGGSGGIIDAPTDGFSYGRVNVSGSNTWGKVAPLNSPALTGTPTAPTASLGTNTTQIASTAFVLANATGGTPATAAPIMDGTAAVGVATKYAREDHVHPSDTSRAPLASPALTGTPTAPTAAPATNTTQIATTAFVGAAISSSGGVTPAALTRTSDTNVTLTLGGTPTTALLQATSITVGWTGTLAAARGGFGADVSGSSGVPLFASGSATFTATTGTGNFVRAIAPTFTGVPLAPTATAGTNTTQIATTAFVVAQAVAKSGSDTMTGPLFVNGALMSAFSQLRAQIIFDSQVEQGLGIQTNNASDSTNGAFVSFGNHSGAIIGGIKIDTSTSVAYLTTSDVRGKPNRELLSRARARDIINQLEVYDYDKDGNRIRGVGLIAQQAYSVDKGLAMPGWADGDWMIEKAAPMPYVLANLQDVNDVLKVLTKSLKEALARIDKLEGKGPAPKQAKQSAPKRKRKR